MLRYKQINCAFFTDNYFVTGKAKSTWGNTMMHLFVSDKGFVYIVPMKSRGEFHLALNMFAKEIGVPLSLILDPSGEQTYDKVTKMCHKMGTTLNILEESTHNSNLAERYVSLNKNLMRKYLQKLDAPMVLWYFCAERRMCINKLNARPLFQIQGQNPHLDNFGEEGDISNVCQFKWYEWAYAMDGAAKFPNQAQFICRVLGPTKNDGNEMAQWRLKANGNIVPRRSVVHLKTSQMNNNEEILKRNVFTNCIRKGYGDSINLTPFPIKLEDLYFSPY